MGSLPMRFGVARATRPWDCVAWASRPCGLARRVAPRPAAGRSRSGSAWHGQLARGIFSAAYHEHLARVRRGMGSLPMLRHGRVAGFFAGFVLHCKNNIVFNDCFVNGGTAWGKDKLLFPRVSLLDVCGYFKRGTPRAIYRKQGLYCL